MFVWVPFFLLNANVETSSYIRHVFEMAAVWAASSLYQHTSIGDRLFASPVSKKMAAISSKQWLTIPWYRRQSTDTPKVSTHGLLPRTRCRLPFGWVLADISADCQLPYLPRVSTNTRSTDALSTHDPSVQAILVFKELTCQFSILLALLLLLLTCFTLHKWM